MLGNYRENKLDVSDFLSKFVRLRRNRSVRNAGNSHAIRSLEENRQCSGIGVMGVPPLFLVGRLL